MCNDGLVLGEDGLTRCGWGAEPEIYRAYHDEEWGRPVGDDCRLFEKICLEGFQAGLSWLTILRKRERFREVFRGFDCAQVAEFGDALVDREERTQREEHQRDDERPEVALSSEPELMLARCFPPRAAGSEDQQSLVSGVGQ